MEIKGNNIQLSYYIMAARLAKRNDGQVALATIEEIYGEEASDKMFSFMQWPESKEWFGKSTCETGTMYYLNSNWANCSMAAIRADIERRMNK